MEERETKMLYTRQQNWQKACDVFSLLCNLSDCMLVSQLVLSLSQTILRVQCLLWNP